MGGEPVPGFRLPDGFLVGAATAAHQVEGNNVASDWWAFEHRQGSPAGTPSGDAADSYHRWREDMDLLSELGFNAYRFSIEWARVEPVRGRVSRAALAHYRRMVEGARQRGLEPVVTLHHFTVPAWFSANGGWTAPEAAELFAGYVRTVAPLVAQGVRYVVTLNEPNMLAVMQTLVREGLEAAPRHGHIEPDPAISEGLIRAHRAATSVLKELCPHVLTGWTVANQVYQPEPPGDPAARAAATAYAHPREDLFLQVSREDGWVGVQSYTRTRVAAHGPLPVPGGAERTLTGWEYHPEALGAALRHTAEVTGGNVPVLVTENGIATADDRRRIDHTARALMSMAEALRDGVDVRGYLHWSALDNYEWGSYEPTFGLIAVDPDTFARTPKESARWLGTVARTGRLPG
ncbi:glycoside hydrolase family 1 protein [Streptomyces iconiensis]|uniref:Family 1 glycosylhydrolase n=1 Tax=Streptomyces iconiensis TaxID=1384038 RepID=A0ABT7A852_9ACTN|nr:family 1 glycosylhydrolase [Streptomyces iconiensis]MDJ1137522.1 family 1 glycosylhydrolase [Streptomyces iconiensis]